VDATSSIVGAHTFEECQLPTKNSDRIRITIALTTTHGPAGEAGQTFLVAWKDQFLTWCGVGIWKISQRTLSGTSPSITGRG
jgi:hypothetical protein